VVGSVPREHSGIASATNTTANQVGGALGVAVVGSLLTTRYTGTIAAAVAGQHVPAAAVAAIRGSIGGALAVAARLPGGAGEAIAHAARGAFASGLDLGMLAAAVVAAGGLLSTLIWLPGRAQAD
jgi:hypothetical protein